MHKYHLHKDISIMKLITIARPCIRRGVFLSKGSRGRRAGRWTARFGLPLHVYASLDSIERKYNRNTIASRASSSSTATTVTDFDEKQHKGKLEKDANTILLTVNGMKCGGCSANVKSTLISHPSVQQASVNLITGTAAITLVPSGNVEQDHQVVADITQGLNKKGFKAELRQGGIENTQQDDNNSTENIWEEFGDLFLSVSLLLLCCGHHAGHFLHTVGWHQGAAILGGHGDSVFGSKELQSAAAVAALLGPGRDIIKDGFKSLVNGVPNMNTLVAIGTSTALGIGLSQALNLPATASWGPSSHLLEEPVMLLSVILLGKALEKRAKRRATRELYAMSKLVPKTCQLVFDSTGKTRKCDMKERSLIGTWSEFETVLIETNSIRAGDVIKVLPGESIPVDGVLVAGISSVDESLLTGESALVQKSIDDKVLAGTISYDGPIIVQATKNGEDCMVNDMRTFIEAAQARDAPIQRLADAVSRPFVYSILGLSALTFVFWHAVGFNVFQNVLAAHIFPLSSMSVALHFAVDVLVVACPCALGLATPTSILVGTSIAAQNGVLIRGGDVLEELAQVDVLVMDKTGTITEGTPSVTHILTSHESPEQVISLAALLEENASAKHPIANAIIGYYSDMDTAMDNGKQRLDNMEYQSGSGVLGSVGGKKVAVGKLSWVLGQVSTDDKPCQSNIDEHHSFWMKKLMEADPNVVLSKYSFVYVAVEDQGIVGCITLENKIREDAKGILAQAHSLGITQMYVLSGDNEAAVKSIAKEIGVVEENAIGELSPFDKASIISSIKSKGHRVLMIGDGINDAPALAEANVGIALAYGMDITAGAADIILVNNSAKTVFGKLQKALEISQTTFSKIKQNLSWALLYNGITLPLASGVLLPSFGLSLDPALAGGMMAGSSLIVILNSLSIHLYNKK